MPPDPLFLECFRQSYFSSPAYTFKISRYAPVIAVLLVILEISQCWNVINVLWPSWAWFTQENDLNDLPAIKHSTVAGTFIKWPHNRSGPLIRGSLEICIIFSTNTTLSWNKYVTGAVWLVLNRLSCSPSISDCIFLHDILKIKPNYVYRTLDGCLRGDSNGRTLIGMAMVACSCFE